MQTSLVISLVLLFLVWRVIKTKSLIPKRHEIAGIAAYHSLLAVQVVSGASVSPASKFQLEQKIHSYIDELKSKHPENFEARNQKLRNVLFGSTGTKITLQANSELIRRNSPWHFCIHKGDIQAAKSIK